ncbi:hypothetical protein TNCV_2911771, partial [Trichonephila clavipes]
MFDWQQVVFSDEPRFNLWDQDGRIRVRQYAGESCLSECIIERNYGLRCEIMDDPICNELRVMQ